MLLTAGERISMALLSMAINDLGRDAVSFTGSQAGHRHRHERTGRRGSSRCARSACARRSTRAGSRSSPASRASRPTSDVTTLGRGGSDTTAVALAAALGAEACEIYTDVEGVYTADPRIVPAARKLAEVSYEEMLELAASGAKVLALRARSSSLATTACRPRPLVVRGGGGHLGGEGGRRDGAGDHLGNRARHRRGEGDDPRRPRPARDRGRVFRPLADAGINIDMIVQNVSAAGHTDISFTLPKTDLPLAEPILERLAARGRGGAASRPTRTSPRCRSSAPA